MIEAVNQKELNRICGVEETTKQESKEEQKPDDALKTGKTGSNEVKEPIDIWSTIPNFKKIEESSATYTPDAKAPLHLYIRQEFSRCKGTRRYFVGEIDDNGHISCLENKDAYFSVEQVEKGASNILSHIKGLRGNYTGHWVDIANGLTKIEEHRLLGYCDIADFEALEFEEIFERLQRWCEEHIDDGRVACFEIRGTKHVAIVKVGEKSLNTVFREIFNDIAPSTLNMFQNFKAELHNRDLLFCDNDPKVRDSQLTIGTSKRAEIGVQNDKVISFRFPDDVRERLYKKYKAHRHTEEVAQNG